MQEILLILSCLGNSGCKEVVAAYEFYNPEKVQYIKDLEQHINPKVKKYVPIFICGTSLNCSFNISKEVNLLTDKNNIKLSYTVGF